MRAYDIGISRVLLVPTGSLYSAPANALCPSNPSLPDNLAHKLLSSLPPPVASTASEMLTEALRRDAELESGAAQPVSEPEFWQGVRRRG